MTGDVVLEARDISIRLDGSTVLERVSLRAYAGEVVALVGPNGAGKSTLLAALAGDLTLASGDVLLNGIPVQEWSAGELAMRRAMLLQQVAVSFPFTVCEVVTMGRAPWRTTERADDDETAVSEAMSVTDVEDLGGRGFNSLSGGERARVALARVLAQRAPVLLLDEPTAALDLHHQEIVMAIVRDRVVRGDTAVVVLHDLNLAAAYADRVVVLASGRIVADGPPADVLDEAVLSHIYGHRVEVLPHPRTGVPLVLPHRAQV